jgi:hypothetical protein
MTWARRCLHVSLLTATAFTVASCGGSETRAQLDPVASAANKTATISSAKVHMTMSMSVPSLSRPVAIIADGAINMAHRRGAFTLDMSRFAREVPSGPFTDPTLWRGEEVYDNSSGGLVIYMNMPVLTRLAHLEKPWVKIDLQAAGKQIGLDMSQFTQLGSGDPSQTLDYLRAASGDVKKVGSDQIRGIGTTHYRATVDLTKYPNLVPPSRRADMRKATKRLIELVGTTTFPAEVWIDTQNRVRRLRMNIPSGSAQTARMTIDYFDFGTPAPVQLPPLSQTVDLANLAGGAGG